MSRPTLPDGRHVIPVANSDSKCLLENWVEERAVEPIDREYLRLRDGVTSMAQILKNGHRGLLTTDFDARLKDLTTHLDAFRVYPGPGVRVKGARQEMMERLFLQRALCDIEREEHLPMELYDPKSVTQSDFTVDDFSPMQPAPTAAHDYRTEQSVTFWSEHRDKVHGISQTKPTFNSAFRKNSAFSRPIDETWEPDQAKPYDHDHYPNM